MAAQTDVDAVVVGAGLAGLVAARDLVAAGRRVVVFEAQDRVGGRTLNHPLGDGQVVEIGGQWIGPTQDRLAALADSLGVETFPTHDEGEHLVEFDGDVRRYSGTIPRLGAVALVDVGQSLLRLDRMATRVPLTAPWTAARAETWDSQTAWSWIRRNVRSSRGRQMLEILIEAVWAQQSRDISLLHLLFYIHSAGGIDALLDVRGGAQQDRFVGGSHLISTRLAADLGDTVRLGAPVRRIRHRDGGVEVVADGQTASADHVVVAVPPTLAGRIETDPAVPGYRDQLVQRMPQGSVVKCLAVYDEPFWRRAGLSGQAVSDAGPARIVFDNTPPSGSPGILLAFLEGTAARELARQPQAERGAAVVEVLRRLFGERAGRPQAYVDRVWADDPWARGCYGAAMPPGAWTGFGPALSAPIGRIHWAGAETATVWNGYMEGAVRSGQRAASEVLTAT